MSSPVEDDLTANNHKIYARRGANELFEKI
jgi:hypothetical protein